MDINHYDSHWVKFKYLYPTPYLKEQLKFLFYFAISLLAILVVSRIIIISLHFNRIGLENIYPIFLGGLRIDVSTILQFISIPCLALLFLTITNFKGNYIHTAIRVWCWIVLLLIVFMEAITPTFIVEYDTRPNRLFFEYLSSPNEVFGMILKGYWIQLVSIVAILSLIGYKAAQYIFTRPVKHSVLNPLNTIYMILLCLLLTVGIRSGFQHRPINPAMVAFSSDQMINALALNSTYSFMFAVYQLRNEESASDFYGNLNEDEMLELIKHNMPQHSEFIANSGIPTLHELNPTGKFENKNLIIIVEESLGAQFVGSLGGKPLTPNIDKWKEKSWFFNNLYATGTRSARGLEAITTGFLPSPARAVLKLPKAQGGFYTIADTLKHQGYETSFIYGGESHFDNMKGFFLANGFEKIIDQKNYVKPQFVGNWGVSDEDLFDKAFEYLKTETGKPKFSLIFSSSNHTPFEFPDGKIELYESKKHTVNNAVKYADFALGGFLDKLEQNHFFENSIVMVVADHDARVMGESLVPIERFHVPGFIIADNSLNKVDNTVVSLIDLAPTLLSLLGIDSVTPMTGHDLSNLPVNFKGRAIMQYGNNQAYLQGDSVTILQPDHKAELYSVLNGKIDTKLINGPSNTALAHALFASWSYNHQKYKTIHN